MNERRPRAGLLLAAVLLELAVFGSVTPGVQAQALDSLAGEIVGMNTATDPPMLKVHTDGGETYLVQAPAGSRVVLAKLGSRISASGSMRGDTFNAATLDVTGAQERSDAASAPCW